MDDNDDKDKDKSKNTQGQSAADQEVFEEFKRAMENKVIPEIVATVEKRRLAAAKNRSKQLKC